MTAGCVENRGAFRENAMRGPAGLDLVTYRAAHRDALATAEALTSRVS
jgi:hypothetical protein